MLYIKRLMVQADNDMRKPLCEIETTLSDGRAICLRTIRPSDEVRIRQGIKEMTHVEPSHRGHPRATVMWRMFGP